MIKSKKTGAIIAGIFLLILLGVTLVTILQEMDPQLKRDEQQIAELSRKVQLGASSDEVRKIFETVDVARLALHEIDPSRWLVSTPMRHAARNWDLWIYFSENKVGSIKIRYADSKEMRPEDAPLDQP